jgi:hypothetical protein
MRFSLRLIPRIDQSPTLLRFGSTPWGRLLFVCVFCLLLWLGNQSHWLLLGLPLSAVAIMPTRRRVITALASFAWAFAFLPFGGGLLYPIEIAGRTLTIPLGWLALIGFYGLAFLLVRWAGRQPEHWFFQRPVRNILLLYTLLLVAAPHLSWFGLWSQLPLLFLLIAGKHLWFLLYSLIDRKRLMTSTPSVQVAHYSPFWGSTNVPFPKGQAYLAKIEAKTDRDFAVSQLKGIKLLMWAIVLMALRALFNELVHGIPSGRGYLLPYHAAIPKLPQLLMDYHRGHPLDRAHCWLSVFSNYAENVFFIAISGHTIIATCRMAGYRALRNTYQPCLARTVAEFYNRIYYYFKEMLVDMFFYPTYFRYFKKHPRLRLFFATMAAACFGNVLFHFLRDYQFIMGLGFWRALLNSHVYLTYGLILGTVIGISQVRSLSRPRPKGRLLPVLQIGVFYSLLMILDTPNRAWSIWDYGVFMLNLFFPIHP